MHQAVRTQIYLPQDLRRGIDSARRGKGESLSDYIRQAAREKLARGGKEKQELKKLAKEFTSGVKKSGWERIDVLKWQREIRQDRKIF